jgi:hypothetical protein
MHQLTVILAFTTMLAGLPEDGSWSDEVRVGYQDNPVTVIYLCIN